MTKTDPKTDAQTTDDEVDDQRKPDAEEVQKQVHADHARQERASRNGAISGDGRFRGHAPIIIGAPELA